MPLKPKNFSELQGLNLSITAPWLVIMDSKPCSALPRSSDRTAIPRPSRRTRPLQVRLLPLLHPCNPNSQLPQSPLSPHLLPHQPLQQRKPSNHTKSHNFPSVSLVKNVTTLVNVLFRSLQRRSQLLNSSPLWSHSKIDATSHAVPRQCTHRLHNISSKSMQIHSE